MSVAIVFKEVFSHDLFFICLLAVETRGNALARIVTVEGGKLAEILSIKKAPK